MKYEIKEISEIKRKIEVELTTEEFDNFYAETLKNLANEIELPGFRKGKAPVQLIEEKANPESVLSEAGENAIRDTWLKILKETKIEAIAAPQVEIIKVAKGNPFIFNLEVEVLPKVELPNIREISAKVCEKKEEVQVADTEVEDTILWLQQSRAKLSNKTDPIEKGDLTEISYTFLSGPSDLVNQEKKDGFVVGKGHFVLGMEDAIVGMKLNEEKTFKGQVAIGKEGNQKEPVEVKVKIDLINKIELPEINDEFAKNIGNFSDMANMRAEIKKGIIQEKEISNRENKRAEVLQKIAEKVKIEIPAVLKEREQEALMNNFKNRVQKEMGVTVEEYLKQIKKTEDEIQKEFEKVASERVKIFLILNQIEKDEKIEATPEELENRISEIIKQYPDSEKAKQEIESSNTRAYIIDEIKREKIFKLLGC